MHGPMNVKLADCCSHLFLLAKCCTKIAVVTTVQIILEILTNYIKMTQI